VGAISPTGKKVIWVNFFCRDHIFRNNDYWWRKSIVSVDGGGKCFFNLKINLSDKKCYDLQINSTD